jgi:hypothetical protein
MSNKMKAIKLIGNLVIISSLLLFIGSNFMGCSQESPVSMVGPQDHDIQSFAKRTVEPVDTVVEEPVSNYPQSAKGIVYYDEIKNQYKGFAMSLPNHSSFILQPGALTPPEGIPLGANIELTWLVELDERNNELIFTFGPNGCLFSPIAEVWFDYSDLGTGEASLFYLEGKKKREVIPESIDVGNGKMLIHIDHFSRYAIAFSR